jgi:hypothetical protein
MPNSLLTITMITREALRILHNNVVFVKGVNRQYSQEFAQTGAKIGDTINVRKPNRYYLRRGQQIQIQGTQENYVPLKLTTQYGCDTEFTSSDLTISLDDFGKRILSPKMAVITSGMDFDGLSLVQQVYNNVGQPTITPGTNNANTGLLTTNAPGIFLNSGMMMDNAACPRDENRRIVMNPIAQAISVSGLSGLFNDQGSLGTQYRKGVMGAALGFEFAMDQNVNIQGSGSHSATTVVTGSSNQSGSVLYCVGAANVSYFPGETFSIASVNSVNPENKQSTGQSQQFCILPSSNVASGNFPAGYYTADSGGNVNLNVSPPMIGPSTPQNPLQTITALPAGGAALTFNMAANATAAVNNIAYHQDAFTLATADLILPGGVDFAARETYDGVSMRIIRAYDITNDLFPTRIDVLAGFAALRPEFACRIWG